LSVAKAGAALASVAEIAGTPDVSAIRNPVEFMFNV